MKSVVSGLLAACGSTVIVTSREGLVTIVVTLGSTPVTLSVAIRGRKKGRSTTLSAWSINTIPSRKLAYGEPSGAASAVEPSMSRSCSPAATPVSVKRPSLPLLVEAVVPSRETVAPTTGVSVSFT